MVTRRTVRNSPVSLFFCSVEIILILIITPSGAPSPPLGDPPVAREPFYLFAIVEISCTDNTEASQCAPALKGGRAGARKGIIFGKHGTAPPCIEKAPDPRGPYICDFLASIVNTSFMPGSTERNGAIYRFRIKKATGFSP